MAEDMVVWLGLVKDAVSWLADEDAQRRAWFGIGPEVDSPAESFNGYLGDAGVEEFLQRDNTGLSDVQHASLQHLTVMVRALCEETNEEEKNYPPAFELPPEFINDPRWQKIIEEAKKTHTILNN